MNITPALFEAFLKCPTQCWLRSTGDSATGNTYAEWVRNQNEIYRVAAAKRLIADTRAEDIDPSLGSGRGNEAQTFQEHLKSAQWYFSIDVHLRPDDIHQSRSSRRKAHSTEPQPSTLNSQPADQSLVTSSATNPDDGSPSTSLETCLHALERIPSAGRGKAAQFIPIRFIYRNKLTKDDKLVLAFDAHVLSKTLGRDVGTGKIIHGDLRDCARSSRGDEAQTKNSEIGRSLLTSAATHKGLHEPQSGMSATPGQPQPRVTKVKTSALTSEVRKRLDKIVALLSNPTPPDLVLNRHCGECEFRDRCRQKAIETDDLSLLANMSAKERQKLRSKGIFTVTQLSYTFRPRRRPKRMRDKKEKYHHALKALAIREKKIHIVGSPELKIDGTPVYLDVEGLPDRDFYYLIGLRIGHGDSAVQHSLWADTVVDEGKIWWEFLGILETVEKPVLIHYGSYETNFMKQMSERHGSPEIESISAKAIASAINLVSVMFAQIYFARTSNGLKDVADSLGYRWTDEVSSGLESIAWRCKWEHSSQDSAKTCLLNYNAQDCEALSLVAQTTNNLARSSTTTNATQNPTTNFVRADIPKRPDDLKWGDFKSSVPGFETINAAAHWNYQRERIYVRNRPTPVKRKNKTVRKKGSKGIELVIIWPVPLCCPKCNYPIRRKGLVKTRTVQDLIYGRNSLKRRLVKYVFRTYLCQNCLTVYGFDERFRIFMKFGWNIAVYFIFHIIEFFIPQRAVAMTFNRLYNFNLHRSSLNYIKSRMGKYYEETKQLILRSIVEGPLVHADETRANIKGTDGYVWVLTNMRDVVYFVADTREAEIIQNYLIGFTGVLVSDFYAAYDSFDCPQQRCLIHLIRDLNTAVLANPFDEQLKGIAASFSDLLRPIVETVDQRGLKKYFLKKHIKEVDHFYLNLSRVDYKSESALKWKDRLERNQGKLFTFLRYDGVPWNNNNAEHAIKAFARLRDVLEGTSTKKGMEEYLTLLSVCQTCKYMGVDFLDFLRSGQKDIHAFAESRSGRRRRKSNSQPPVLPADTTLINSAQSEP